MNARAKKMGLANTVFVDPSGLDEGNVSTAREVAALGLEAFAVNDIRRMTTTAKYELVAAGKSHSFKNTNGLLVDENNGLYVTGGKTGYIGEQWGWNLVTTVADPVKKRSVTVVVMGSQSKPDSFTDAEKAVRWLWANYEWK